MKFIDIPDDILVNALANNLMIDKASVTILTKNNKKDNVRVKLKTKWNTADEDDNQIQEVLTDELIVSLTGIEQTNDSYWESEFKKHLWTALMGKIGMYDKKFPFLLEEVEK